MKKASKRLLSILLALSLTLALCACGAPAAPAAESTNAPEAAAPAEEPAASELDDLPDMKIIFSTGYPADSGVGKAAVYLKELVEERSNGKLTVEVHTDGTMGSDKENIELLTIGEIQMASIGALAITTLAPEYSFFDAPFVFRSKEHFQAVWNGELGDGVRQIWLDNNIRYVDYLGRGYRYFTSNVPLTDVNDLSQLTIRMPESKPYLDTFSELGCVCVPISLTELFTSLQMGVVNSSEGPIDQIYSYKLYEVQDYIALSGHLYTFNNQLVNDEWYSSLPEAYKAIIDEASHEAALYGTELNEGQEAELMQKMKDLGVTFTEIDNSKLVEKAQPAVAKLFESEWPVTTAEFIAGF